MKLIFCLVGLSRHSLNRLIPSILKSRNTLKYVVSSKKNSNLEKIIFFKNLKEAINKIDKKTIFILCTPPDIHEKQALYLIKRNFNIIIEKPSFLSIDIINNFYVYKKKNRKFLYENFMYRYSHGFNLISSILKNFKDDILSIRFNFIIPSYPDNSFRNNSNYTLSTIFDIGCYITSFILLSNIKIEDIYIKKNIFQNSIIRSSLFLFINSNYNIEAKIGRSKYYKNDITIFLKNDFKIKLKSFFYGLNKKKKFGSFSQK